MFDYLTANIRGINCPKRNKTPSKILEIFSHIQNPNSIVVCTETNISPSKKIGFRPPKNFKIIASTSNGRGSGILIFGPINANVIVKTTIVPGRVKYVCIEEGGGGNLLHLYAVYLSSSNSEAALALSAISLHHDGVHTGGTVALLGDFNADFSNPAHSQKADNLKKTCQSLNVHDIGAHLNNFQFTWRGAGQRFNSFSRIDMIFCNSTNFQKFDTLPLANSDHFLVYARVKSDKKFFKPQWKNWVFHSKEFNISARQLIAETIFDNIPMSSRKYDFHHYKLNPHLLDNPVFFSDLQYGAATVLHLIINKLKVIHDKYFLSKKNESHEQSKRFVKQYNDLIDSIYKDNSNIDSVLLDLDLLKNQQINYFYTDASQKQENFFLKSFNDENKLTANMFRRFRKPNNSRIELLINGQSTHDPTKIVQAFHDGLKTISGPTVTQKSTLKNFFDFFQIDPDSAFPKIDRNFNGFSQSQIKEVLSKISNTSAVGLSSENKALYVFIFTAYPKIFSAAINDLIKIPDLNLSPFAYLKKRKVVFIHKKNSDPKVASNYRPIALLEMLYKIVSKLFAYVTRHDLPKILDSDQFGFIHGKQMASASLSLFGAINTISNSTETAQIMSCDIRKAFDSVSTQLLNEIVHMIYPKTFASNWNNWCTNGYACATYAGFNSNFFKITTGVPQGCPSSASRYLLVHHLFALAFHSIKLSDIMFKLEKNNKTIRLNSIFFADDTLIFLALKNNTQVYLLKQAFNILGDVTGLYLNHKKTAILSKGHPPSLLKDLGVISDSFTHLGIQISFDLDKACRSTYEIALKKFKDKAKSVFFQSCDTIIKRRNIIHAILSSQFFHIYRIFPPPCPETSKEIFKILRKTLWGKFSPDGFKVRTRIAWDRVTLPISRGGLGLWHPSDQADASWLNHFVQFLKFIHDYPESLANKLLEINDIDISPALASLASKSIKSLKKLKKIFFPPSANHHLFKFSNFFEKLEEDPLTFQACPINRNKFESDLFKFTSSEIHELADCSPPLVSIGRILKKQFIGDKFIYLQELNPDIETYDLHHSIICKLKNIIRNLPQNCFSNFVAQNKKKFFMRTQPFFMQFCFYDRRYFSKAIKRFHFLENDRIPPAITSRIKDNVDFPTTETFMLSFEKVLNMKIQTKFKSFHLEYLNRTLVSKSKLFHFKQSDSNICSKCNVISTTEHALYFCTMPFKFSDLLVSFLDKKVHNDVPKIGANRLNLCLHNILIPELPVSIHCETTHLCLNAKVNFLRLSRSENWTLWPTNVMIAHFINFTRETIKLRLSTNSSISFLYDFENFLIQSIDS